MKSEVCSTCGEELRHGVRPPVETDRWLHREDVDHLPTLGYLMTAEDWARIEIQLDEPRIATDGSVYTTRQYDHAREATARAKVEKKAVEAGRAEEPEPIELPEPEVRATPITRGDPRFPGGCATIANLADKNGWRWTATYSRGPRTHATHGNLLSISDWVIMRLALDDGVRRAVGFWCDTKFTHAWLAELDVKNWRYNIFGSANSNGLKAYIRGDDET